MPLAMPGSPEWLAALEALEMPIVWESNTGHYCNVPICGYCYVESA